MIFYTKISHEIIRISPTEPNQIKQNQVDTEMMLEFLNPLCCNQLIPLNEPKFAAILSNKGNVQASFIAQANADDILLQTASPQILGGLLARYKLSTPIRITKTNHAVFAIWSDDADDGKAIGNFDINDAELNLIADPRITPHRIYYLRGNEASCDNSLSSDFLSAHATKTDAQTWHAMRMALGLIDDEYQQHDFLPHHLHYDALNGIDWKKGCYPGQEICARIHFKGKVKRKIFPVSFSQLSESMDVVNQKKERVGHLVSHVENPHENSHANPHHDKFIGLAFINETAMGEPLFFNDETAVKTLYPNWLQAVKEAS